MEFAASNPALAQRMRRAAAGCGAVVALLLVLLLFVAGHLMGWALMAVLVVVAAGLLVRARELEAGRRLRVDERGLELVSPNATLWLAWDELRGIIACDGPRVAIRAETEHGREAVAVELAPPDWSAATLRELFEALASEFAARGLAVEDMVGRGEAERSEAPQG